MGYANPALLWSVDDLKSKLNDPKLVLLDTRPPEAYSNEHIPGSRSLDIFGISLIDTRPEPLKAFLWMIAHLIQSKGVNQDSTVIVYDDIAGNRSARLFWFLELFGHSDIHMLNGGQNAWVTAGQPLTHKATVVASPGNFKMNLRRELLATVDDVLDCVHKPGAVIVDTRSDEEYTGRLVRALRGGAIPGAVHLEWTRNLDDKGFFKSAEQLHEMYAAHNIAPDKEIIPHCHGGYRSAHTYVALRLIGYPKIRNYLGSWGEWGNRPDLPIEVPAQA